MLRIGQIHIRDDVHDTAVCLLGQTFVLAAVAGFHVEDRDMQALGGYGRKTRVRIPENQQRIGLRLNHQFVGAVDDVTYRCTKVIAHGIHVDLRVLQFQVLEEYPVEVVIVVLARMSQDRVEVDATLADYGSQTNDLRPCSDDDEEFEFAVVGEFDIRIVEFDLFHLSCVIPLVQNRYPGAPDQTPR